MATRQMPERVKEIRDFCAQVSVNDCIVLAEYHYNNELNKAINGLKIALEKDMRIVSNEAYYEVGCIALSPIHGLMIAYGCNGYWTSHDTLVDFLRSHKRALEEIGNENL